MLVDLILLVKVVSYDAIMKTRLGHYENPIGPDIVSLLAPTCLCTLGRENVGSGRDSPVSR